MSKYYNQNSEERYQDEKILTGNPSGIINMADSSLRWCKPLWDVMLSYTWFVQELNLGQDKKKYQQLSDEQKKAFNLALAQLITNDSIQTVQLADGVSGLITSPSVKALLARQAYEEALHSMTYTAIADDVIGSRDVYNLHQTDLMLAKKNLAVEDMFNSLNTIDPIDQEKQLIFVANQILEQLVFPGGFIVLWSFGFSGTSSAISFIERDEFSHVNVFKNIFREAKNEIGLSEYTEIKALSMIDKMTKIEIEWTKHISKDLLGFSDKAIELYIEYQGNQVCKNLRLPLLYEETDGGPLMNIYNQNSLLKGSSTKTNFFEAPVADYSVGSLDEDY